MRQPQRKKSAKPSPRLQVLPSLFGLDRVRTQRKVKLGNTSLYGFLKDVLFEEDRMTTIGAVITVSRKLAKNEGADKLSVGFRFEDKSPWT